MQQQIFLQQQQLQLHQQQQQNPQQAVSQQTPPKSAGVKGPVQLVDLPRMDNREIGELIAGLLTRFEVELGYGPANEAQQKLLAAPAKVVPVGPVITRVDSNRRPLLMRFGFLRQPGQLPQLWASGKVGTDPTLANPDGAKVDAIIATILSSREKSEADLSFTELRSQMVNLAYVDAESAAGVLKAMGFNVINVERASAVTAALQSALATGMQGTGVAHDDIDEDTGLPSAQTLPKPSPSGGPGAISLPRRVRNGELPLFIRLPSPNAQDVGLVGAGADGTAMAPGSGQSGLTTILGAYGRLATETVSSPTTQLMVLYNPDRPEQLGLAKKVIKESIDTPARQVVIEAMVMEVTSSGLRELGVNWNYQKGFNTASFGSLSATSVDSTLNFFRDRSITELVKSFNVKLEALVQSGKAEVLARPSVLTLDNRQATIRVGTDIPIATSRDSSSGATDSRVSYSFFYLPTGIQLNVRPRIDNDGNEVSLQVDAAVSTTVANLGTQIRSPGDVVLAAAPAVSTRRVQTYARIPNGTPLIIGGLISRTRDDVANSTPIVGEIPLLGALFGAKRGTSSRDEVIIVLTPYVIESGRANLEAALPKDAPAFEYSRENELFRKNLRLRAEDMLNLAYIRDNARLLTYRRLVNRINSIDPLRVENSPLVLVEGNKTPGEQTLMAGMLLKLLKNRYEGKLIDPENMIVFNDRNQQGEIVVGRLGRVLAKMGNGRDPESFFRSNPDKCLAITFVSHRQDMVGGNILAEPEPQTRTVECKPDRSDWASILYQLNKNTAAEEFNTILLKDESDLATLSHAIALRRLIQINGGKSALNFEQLAIGRVLSMPEFGARQDHLLESDIARYFYLAQHYYRAFEEDFEEGMSAIEKALRSGKYNDIVSSDEIPRLAAPVKAP